MNLNFFFTYGPSSPEGVLVEPAVPILTNYVNASTTEADHLRINLVSLLHDMHPIIWSNRESRISWESWLPLLGVKSALIWFWHLVLIAKLPLLGGVPVAYSCMDTLE